MWFRLTLAEENIGGLTSFSHTRDSVPKVVRKIHILSPHYVILTWHCTSEYLRCSLSPSFARPYNGFCASTPLGAHTEDIHGFGIFSGAWIVMSEPVLTQPCRLVPQGVFWYWMYNFRASTFSPIKKQCPAPVRMFQPVAECTVTGLRTGRSGAQVTGGTRGFSLLHIVQTCCLAHPALYFMDTRVLPDGNSTAEFRNDRRCTSTPPICLYVVWRDIFRWSL